MMIPTGVRHFATLQASMPYFVRCTHCNTEFIYLMTRTGQAIVESSLFATMEPGREQARKMAERKLKRKLLKRGACDPVPCPNCFQFQPYMKAVSARRRYGQIPTLGCFLVVFGILIAGLAIMLRLVGAVTEPGVYWAAGAGLLMLLCGLCLGWLGNFLQSHHDPNNMPLAHRQTIAAERAILPEVFAKYQESQAEAAFDDYLRERKRARRRGEEQWEEDNPFTFQYWLPPALLANGGQVSLTLPEGEMATLTLAPSTQPNTLIDLPTLPGSKIKFQVRVLAMRVHSEERRLE